VLLFTCHHYCYHYHHQQQQQQQQQHQSSSIINHHLMCKEYFMFVTVKIIKALSQHLPGGTEENHKTLQSGKVAFWLGFKLGTYEI
jgi:hypothetical protein